MLSEEKKSINCYVSLTTKPGKNKVDFKTRGINTEKLIPFFRFWFFFFNSFQRPLYPTAVVLDNEVVVDPSVDLPTPPSLPPPPKKNPKE